MSEKLLSVNRRGESYNEEIHQSLRLFAGRSRVFDQAYARLGSLQMEALGIVVGPQRKRNFKSGPVIFVIPIGDPPIQHQGLESSFDREFIIRV